MYTKYIQQSQMYLFTYPVYSFRKHRHIYSRNLIFANMLTINFINMISAMRLYICTKTNNCVVMMAPNSVLFSSIIIQFGFIALAQQSAECSVECVYGVSCIQNIPLPIFVCFTLYISDMIVFAWIHLKNFNHTHLCLAPLYMCTVQI